MVRIGIIGCGGIARGKHIPELLAVEGCKITAVCDVNAEQMAKAVEAIGDKNVLCFTDYKQLVDCDEVDAVEVCTPNYLHVPMAEYAVSRGKPINVEKPLALSAKEAEGLWEATRKSGVPNMMCFSYRFFPAVRYAKALLEKHAIGKIVGLQVEYSKSSAFWEGRRLDWRFVKEYAGTGVLGDLGVHLIDMATFLVGNIKSVSAMTGIVVPKRQKEDSEEWADVETDDYCNFIARLDDRENGGEAAATFSITRCAIGHSNTIRYDIFGTEGAISFNLNDPTEISLAYANGDVRKAALVTEKVPAEYSIKQEQMFADLVSGRECKYLPTVADGVQAQRILDALLSSAERGETVTL